MGVLRVRANGQWVDIGTSPPPAPLACKLTISAAYAVLNNTQTAVAWDVEVFDASEIHATGTPTRITIPTSGGGLWLVGYSTSWFPASTGSRGAYIRLNGNSVGIYGSYEKLADGTATGQPGSALFRLVPTDYLELVVYHTQGVTHSLRGGTSATALTEFWATRLGD